MDENTLTLEMTMSLLPFKDNALEYRAKRTEIVPLSKYIRTTLYLLYISIYLSTHLIEYKYFYVNNDDAKLYMYFMYFKMLRSNGAALH